MQEQYKTLVNKKFDSLKNDKIFDGKLQEFCSMVRPDSEFFEQIKQKELYLLQKDTKTSVIALPYIESEKKDFRIHSVKTKSIDLNKEEKLDAEMLALIPENLKKGAIESEGVTKEIANSKKILDDMGLGTKTRGMAAGDFTGSGSDGIGTGESSYD